MKIKWFNGVKTLDELRKTYRQLALKNHPDKGGNTADMQEINAEYDYLSKNLINSNKDFSDARKTYEHQTSENLKGKINEILFLPDVIVEIIGSWIWVTGKTYAVKDQLKTAGFTFSHNKVAWYWHCGEYVKLSKKKFDLDTIRVMYGSQTVEPEEREEYEQKRKHKFSHSVN